MKTYIFTNRDSYKTACEFICQDDVTFYADPNKQIIQIDNEHLLNEETKEWLLSYEEKKCLIASTKVVSDPKKFFDILITIAKDVDCRITAIYGIDGPNCYNYAIKIVGENWRQCIESITLSLQPARWCLTDNNFDGFKLT